MAVAVQGFQIQPKERRESDLDKIIKGLSIAESITGTAANIQKFMDYRDQKALRQAEGERAVAGEERAVQAFEATQAEQERKNKGVLNVSELLDAQTKLESVPQGTKGAMPYTVRRGESEENVFLRSRPKETSELDIALKQARLEGLKNTQSIRSEEMAFKSLPKDKQIQVAELSKRNAQIEVGATRLRALAEQLKDPNLSGADKVIVGKQSLKLINDAIGSDAAGAEEVKRLGSLLEVSVIPRTLKGEVGAEFGRDIDLFTRGVENNLGRLDSSVVQTQEKIDSLLGRVNMDKNMPELDMKEQALAELKRRQGLKALRVP